GDRHHAVGVGGGDRHHLGSVEGRVEAAEIEGRRVLRPVGRDQVVGQQDLANREVDRAQVCVVVDDDRGDHHGALDEHAVGRGEEGDRRATIDVHGGRRAGGSSPGGRRGHHQGVGAGGELVEVERGV